jgi:DNA-directed RNA polymerase specialized sigma24 family protein
VVVLRFYEDLAESDIADVMGISVGTVKSTLHRGLAHLRKQLGEEVV